LTEPEKGMRNGRERRKVRQVKTRERKREEDINIVLQ